MKHTRIPFVMCMVLLCVACNSNESKIKEFAGQFAKAANIKDTTTVCRNYPSIKNYRFLLLPDNLSADKITITFNNDENNYVASLNADKKLVITLDSIGTCRIVDSYNVLKFDPKYNEVATLALTLATDIFARVAVAVLECRRTLPVRFTIYQFSLINSTTILEDILSIFRLLRK